jgi:hypothetical protein
MGSGGGVGLAWAFLHFSTCLTKPRPVTSAAAEKLSTGFGDPVRKYVQRPAKAASSCLLFVMAVVCGRPSGLPGFRTGSPTCTQLSPLFGDKVMVFGHYGKVYSWKKPNPASQPFSPAKKSICTRY